GVYVCPALAMVCGSPDAADSASNVGSRKNVTIGIDGQGANIEFNYALARISPTVPVAGRTTDPAEAVHKLGSRKEAAVGTDGQGPHKVREETVVNLFPALTVVAGSKRANPIGASEDGPVKLGRDRPNIGRDQAVVFLNPRIAVVA